MKQFFTTHGRLNRGKYFMYGLITGIVSAVFQMLPEFSDSTLLLGTSIVVSLVSLYVSICITVKRLHDIGKPRTCFFY